MFLFGESLGKRIDDARSSFDLACSLEQVRPPSLILTAGKRLDSKSVGVKNPFMPTA